MGPTQGPYIPYYNFALSLVLLEGSDLIWHTACILCKIQKLQLI